MLVAGAACAEPTASGSFVGLWVGSSAVFTLLQLNLSAEADTAVHGAAQFVFAATATTWADTDFVAAVRGDSLVFAQPVPPFTGYDTVAFRGRRQGATMNAVANGTPIVLTRQ